MKKQAGISLLIFIVLLVFTMVLHPAGGSVAHLIKITNIIIITHAIAILSLPFGWVGFRGLTQVLGRDRFDSILAFAFISIGLVAVLIAAATNGLTMPVFLQDYKDASPETIESIRPVLRYSFAINQAFDYVYTFAFCIAILLWSFAILRTKTFAAWVGWLGIIVAVGAAVLFISGIAMQNLTGFRLFVSVVVLWMAVMGWKMITHPRA
jgi:hypothetical protein